MENFNMVLEAAEKRFHELQPVDRFGRLNQFRLKVESERTELLSFTGSGAQFTQPLTLRDHALKQLCARIGVPYSFYSKCPKPLQEFNAAWFMQNTDQEKDVMLRIVKENEVRAIVSDRYAPFDDIELFRVLDEFMDGTENVTLQSFEEKSSHVRITWPAKTVEVQPGDIVEQGIHIANSEIGLRSVTIMGIVHRLKCKNGLVAREKKGGFRHIGDPARIKEHVRQVMDDVQNDSARLMERFRLSLQEEIEKPVEVIDQLANDHDLTQEEFKSVLDSYMLEPSRNLFGVVNAVSNAAQKSMDMDRRFEMETIAGSVLDTNLAN